VHKEGYSVDNLNTKAVVSLLGVNEHTLRAWERRYGAVTPARSPEGRRSYSGKDIERLRLLIELTNQGHHIGNVATLPMPKLRALKGLMAPVPAASDPIEAEAPAGTDHLNRILETLENFDLEKLNQALLTARFELSQKSLVMHLILPLMAKVGNLVICETLSIAQEHILSSLLRDHIGQIYHSLSPYEFSSRMNHSTFALTTREGDMHEFGILISAILCALHRKRTHYLGPNLPARDVVFACKQFSIQNLVLGLSPIPESREIISPQDFLSYLDKNLPKNVTIWIGGGGIFDLEALNSQRKILVINRIEEFDNHLAKDL
jgi:MerR family transcriptional regulator, light-induced transcriptional regulator